MKKPSLKSSNNFLKIGDAAKTLGVSIDTLRRWEKAGKITVQRTLGGTRLYPLNVKIGDASKILGVSIDTLRRWEASGKIQTIRTSGGTRLYPLQSLKRIAPEKPKTIKPSQTISSDFKGVSTQELLKRVASGIDSSALSSTPVPSFPSSAPSLASKSLFSSKIITKFLIGTGTLAALTLVLTSLITTSYLTSPRKTQQFLKGNIASKLLSPFNSLSKTTLSVISPKIAEELEPPPPIQENIAQLNNSPKVLAVTSASQFLEINSDTQINGNLSVLHSINGVVMEGTPSANTLVLQSGNTVFSLSNSATLDQDLSTTSSPTFSSLTASTITLSASSNQITSNGNTYTLPSGSTTLVGTDTTQTLTNKSISGSSNTLTNIPNSALVNSKITISPGTNLTGGGDAQLGGSVSISLKDSIVLPGTLAVSGASTLTGATTIGSTLAVTGATTLSNTLDVTGAATFNSTINTNTLSSTALTFSGNSPVISSANTQISLQGGVGIGYTASTTPTFPDLGLSVFGNVGIGTTSPSYKLQVIGDANFSSITVGSCNGCTSSGGTILASDGTYSSPSISFLSDQDTGLWRIGSNHIGLTTGGSAFSGISINSSGNVGIGTSDASYKLEVNGSGYISGNVGVGGSLNVNSHTTLGSLSVSGSSSLTDTGITGKLNVSGNVGIGSSLNVTSLLSAGSLSSNGSLVVSGSSFLQGLTATDINSATLTTSGNVGVGGSITGYGNLSGLNVSGLTSLASLNALNVNSSSLNTTGNIGVGQSLTVSSASVLDSLQVTKSVSSATLGVSGESHFNTINTSGNVGVGSSLNVTSNGSFGSLSVSGHSIFSSLTSSNINTSSLNATGNVGIGGSLTVNGLIVANAGVSITSLNATNKIVTPALQLTTGASSNYVLVSDSSGNGSWSTIGGSSITPDSLNFTEISDSLSLDSSTSINTSGNNLSVTGSGTVSFQNTGGFTVDSSATFNSSINTNTFTSTALIFSGSGNVNIGATASSTNLNILTGTGGLINFAGGSSSNGCTLDTTNGSFTCFGNIGLGSSGGASGFWGRSGTTLSPSFSGDSITTSGNISASGTGTITSGGTLTAQNGLTLSTGALSLTSTSGSVGLTLSSSTQAFTVNNNVFSIDTFNSRVGIGTSTPGSRLQVSGNSSIGFGTAAIAGPTNGLIVNGNVGVGTSNSSNFKLQVNGDIGPELSNTYDLGSSTNRFKSIYLSGDLNLSGGITGSNLSQGGVVYTGANGAITSTSSQFYFDSSTYNLGIGTSSPSQRFQVNTNTSNPFVVTSTGNVGIGTTSPISALSVTGSGLASAASTNGVHIGIQSGYATIEMSGGTSQGSLIDFTQNGTDYNSRIIHTNSDNQLGIYTDLFTVNANTSRSSSGKQRLAEFVTGLSAGGNRRLQTGVYEGSLYIQGLDAGSAARPILFQPDGGNIGIGITAGGTPIGKFHISGNGTTTGLTLVTENSNRSQFGLAVLDNGNVGIGTTSPAQKLVINAGSGGDGRIQIARGSNNTYIGPFSSFFDLFTDDSIPFRIANGGTTKVTIDTSGNVGIGATTVNSKLSVAGNAHIGSIRQGISAPTDGLFVDGNVGIGATTSINKLDVWGNTRITGTLTVDGAFNTGSGSSSSSLFLAGDGSASAPSYSFLNDTDTGIFRPSTNALGFATASSTKMTLTDAGNLGIGLTNPYAKLFVGADPGTRTNMSDGAVFKGQTSLGATTGSYVYPSEIINLAGNNIRLQSALYRNSAGSDWTNTEYRLQYAVDDSFTDGSKSFVGIGSSAGNGRVTLGTAGNERLTINSGGNVGIGMNPGAYKVSVAGSLLSTVTGSNMFINDTAGEIYIGNTAGAQAAYRLYNGGAVAEWSLRQKASSTSNDFAISKLVSGTYSDYLSITTGGNVGIGWTSPSSALGIKDAGSISWEGTTASIVGQSTQYLTLTGQNSYIRFNNNFIVDNRDAWNFNLYGSTTSVKSFAFYNGNGTSGQSDVRFGIGTAGPLFPLDLRATTTGTSVAAYLSTGAGGQFAQLGNGNIGIGTTAPSGAFHLKSTNSSNNAAIFENPTGNSILTITGNSNFNTAEINFQSGAAAVSPSNPLWRVGHAGHTQGYLDFYEWNGSANVYRMSIDTNGNVGIGSSARPAVGIFQVSPPAKKEAFFVGTNGNIGIGTTSPNSLVTTIGNVTATASTNDQLVYLRPTFTSSSGLSTGYAINVQGADQTTTGNTTTLGNFFLNLTGNAAKTGTGLYSEVDSSSTTADTIIGVQSTAFASGAISSGTRNLYGFYDTSLFSAANSGGTTNLYSFYGAPTAGSATTGSTNNIYGAYLKSGGTLTTGGIINNYGLYVGNGSTNTTGTSSKYGIYLESQTGSDLNYSIYSAGGTSYFGGNVGIGTSSPSYPLHVTYGGSNDTAYFENANGFYALNAFGYGSNGAGAIISGTSYGLTATTNSTGLSGTIGEAAALYAYTLAGAGTTYTNAYGLTVLNGQGSGTITSNYGINIASQTKGSTNNYGLYIGGASGGSGTNAALWVNSGTTYFGGNVGLGTASPAGKLHISSGDIIKESPTGYDGVWDNLIKYMANGDPVSNPNRWIGADATITAGGASSNKLSFRVYPGGTNNPIPINVLTLTGAGNVGIGTTNPGALLNVGRNTMSLITGVNAVFNATTNSQYGGIQINSFDDDTKRFAIVNNNGQTTIYAAGSQAMLTAGTDGSNPFTFITNNSERMRLDTNGSLNIGYAGQAAAGKLSVNGNVGIGTTNPGADLQIAGSNSFHLQVAYGPSAYATGASVIIADSSNTYSAPLGNSSLAIESQNSPFDYFGSSGASMSNDIVLYNRTNTARQFRIGRFDTSGGQAGWLQAGNPGPVGVPILLNPAGGNVGIGTSIANIGSALQVKGAAAIGYDNAVTAPTNGLLVNGNVGIGFTSPAALLHLNATVANNPHIRISDGATPLARLGDVGVGNDGLLQLYDSTGLETVRLRGSSSESFFWGGNLGIGTTGTTALLHLVGSQPAAVSSSTGTNASNVLTILGGTGGNTSASAGTGGVGGAISITGGTGGAAVGGGTTPTGGVGGAITITAGAGARVTGGSSNNIGGAGGALNLLGGAGATSTNGSSVGAGGNINLTGGAAGINDSGSQVSANGGSIFLAGGLANGSGSNGNIFLGVDSSSNIRGNVGIGTTSAASAKLWVEQSSDFGVTVNTGSSTTLNPKLYLRNASSLPGIITGAAGLHLKGNDNDNFTKGIFIKDSTGNVGIGTSSTTQATLHIADVTNSVSAAILISATTDTTNNSYRIGRLPADGHLEFSGNQNSNSGFRFMTTTGGTNATRMAITNSGNVGIGISNPTRLLQVQSMTAGSAILNIFDNSGGASTPMIQLGINSSNGFQTADAIRIWGTAGTAGRADLNFAGYDSNGGGGPTTPKMTFTGEGNLGIGESTPNAKLNIRAGFAGDGILIDGHTASDFSPLLSFRNQSRTKVGTLGLAMANDHFMTGTVENDLTLFTETGGGNLYLGSAGAKRMKLATGGTIGITGLGSASATSLCYDTTTNSGFNTFTTCSSSIRYKEDIQPLNISKEALFALDPVNFKWIGKDERSVGFIAEEVYKHIPEVVNWKDGQIEGLEYKLLTPYIIGVMKEMDTDIQANKTKLSLVDIDSEGNIQAPKVRTNKLLLSDDVVIDPQSLGNTLLAYEFGASETNTTTNTTYGVASVNVLDSLKSLDQALAEVIDSEATNSAAIAGIQSEQESIKYHVSSIKDELEKLASDSAELNTKYSLLDTKLTPPDILYATGSAQLANLLVTSEATVSGMLRAYDVNISNSLTSLGSTTLANTSINGDLSIDGTLKIENGSEINVLGNTLYLQKSILSGGIDVFNGVITMDTNGNITSSGKVIATEIKTNKLTISNTPVATSSATLGASIGTGTISAGSTSVTINTNQVKSTSKIFITPRTRIGTQSLVVETITPNTSFKVSMDHTISTDTSFDWWIVETQ